MLPVAALKVNETLKELYLADNKLMPSDGIQLGSLLRYNRTLHLLDLRNNHLQVRPGMDLVIGTHELVDSFVMVLSLAPAMSFFCVGYWISAHL